MVNRLVEQSGVEPEFAACKTAVLPLNYCPEKPLLSSQTRGEQYKLDNLIMRSVGRERVALSSGKLPFAAPLNRDLASL